MIYTAFSRNCIISFNLWNVFCLKYSMRRLNTWCNVLNFNIFYAFLFMHIWWYANNSFKWNTCFEVSFISHKKSVYKFLSNIKLPLPFYLGYMLTQREKLYIVTNKWKFYKKRKLKLNFRRLYWFFFKIFKINRIILLFWWRLTHLSVS